MSNIDVKIDIFQLSSAVEQFAVNEKVDGSIPSAGDYGKWRDFDCDNTSLHEIMD